MKKIFNVVLRGVARAIEIFGEKIWDLGSRLVEYSEKRSASDTTKLVGVFSNLFDSSKLNEAKAMEKFPQLRPVRGGCGAQTGCFRRTNCGDALIETGKGRS